MESLTQAEMTLLRELWQHQRRQLRQLIDRLWPGEKNGSGGGDDRG